MMCSEETHAIKGDKKKNKLLNKGGHVCGRIRLSNAQVICAHLCTHYLYAVYTQRRHSHQVAQVAIVPAVLRAICPFQ
jgi:hypothetical protein